jgi:hypothetical protein
MDADASSSRRDPQDNTFKKDTIALSSIDSCLRADEVFTQKIPRSETPQTTPPVR